MLTRHELTCQRPGCARTFTATRSDAQFCSRSCRRRHDTPSPAPTEAADSPPLEDMDGWRRLPGGYVIPPPDPRFTFTPDDLGGL
jgi:hypothetical protein